MVLANHWPIGGPPDPSCTNILFANNLLRFSRLYWAHLFLFHLLLTSSFPTTSLLFILPRVCGGCVQSHRFAFNYFSTMTLHWLSLNVQGMNSPPKRVKIFKYLKRQHVDVACTQETHFSSTSSPKYFDAQYPQVFLANGPTKQRGVLIAFRKSVPFNCVKQIADPDGRYLLLVGTIQDAEVTIMSYYASNSNPGPFLSHVCSLLMSHQRGPCS